MSENINLTPGYAKNGDKKVSLLTSAATVNLPDGRSLESLLNHTAFLTDPTTNPAPDPVTGRVPFNADLLEGFKAAYFAGKAWAENKFKEFALQCLGMAQSIPLGDVSDTAITHRNNFRGKNLGNVVTPAQRAAIQNGSFDDLWLGDYWVIGGHNWRIVDINYWLNCGDNAVPPNHLVIMPDKVLYSHVMNDTNITTGGYIGSKMYTEGLAQAKTIIASAFPGMVLSHREFLVNAVANGKPSAGAWYDSTLEIPNEIMIYGCHVLASQSDGQTIVADHTTCNSQLALMAAYPRFIKTRESYWMRDVVSNSRFAFVGSDGAAGYFDASNLREVRPVFAIG